MTETYLPTRIKLSPKEAIFQYNKIRKGDKVKVIEEWIKTKRIELPNKRAFFRILDEYKKNGFVPKDWKGVNINFTIDIRQRLTPQEAIEQYSTSEPTTKSSLLAT